MKLNQLKAGVIISYLTQGLHIAVGLLYTPLMLRLLGQSEYGLYQMVFSVVSYLRLLSLGFGSGYMRFYSRYKVKNDTMAIARLNGMFLLIFTVLSSVCLILGSVLIIRADLVFGSGLTSEELFKAKILMSMMVVSTAISFFSGVFVSYITAHEKFVFHRLIEFVRVLLDPVLALPLLLLGFGSVGMVGVSVFLVAFSLISYVVFCFKQLKMSFSFKKFNFKLLKELWVFTFFIFLGMIVDQINWSVDKFLLGNMVGTIATAIYSVAAQLNTLYMSLSTSVSAVFAPKVNMLVAKGDNDSELTSLFNRVGRIQFVILALVITGYVLFGKEFIYFWAGAGYDESYVVGLLLMVPATIPFIQNLGIEIQRAKNLHKVRSVIYTFIALTNVALSVFFIKYFGVVGAAVGTAVSLLVGNGLFMNLYYHKKVKLDVIDFWKQILKFTPALLLTTILGYLLNVVFPSQTIVFFCLKVVLYTAAYCVCMWFIGVNQYEKNLIIRLLGKVFHRR